MLIKMQFYVETEDMQLTVFRLVDMEYLCLNQCTKTSQFSKPCFLHLAYTQIGDMKYLYFKWTYKQN